MVKQDMHKTQSEKFKTMAKEIEADGDEKSFDLKLKKIANIKEKQKDAT